MAGPYPRPDHSSPFSDSSPTDGTVVVAAIETGLEALEALAASGLTVVGYSGSAYNTPATTQGTRLFTGPVTPTTGSVTGDLWLNTSP